MRRIAERILLIEVSSYTPECRQRADMGIRIVREK